MRGQKVELMLIGDSLALAFSKWGMMQMEHINFVIGCTKLVRGLLSTSEEENPEFQSENGRFGGL